MMAPFTGYLSAALAFASLATAQTYTTCDPTKKDCTPNTGLAAKTFSTNFMAGEKSSWTITSGTNTVVYNSNGANFIVTQKGDAPTIETDFYIFFGYIEVKTRASLGQGIVSSIVLQSEDLDEIDWEWLGTVPNQVQTNFFGKGDTSSYNRMVPVTVDSATTKTHTYGLNWTSTSIQWLYDGAVVRTLAYTDALTNGGKNYPQTPCKLKLGNWAGGASDSDGTVTWAGGKTDFTKGPFTMVVESVRVDNYNPASQYVWSDKTGSYSSINVVGAAFTSNSSSVTTGNSGASNSSSSSSSSSSSARSSSSSVSSGTTLASTATKTSATYDVPASSSAAAAASSSAALVATTKNAAEAVRGSSSLFAILVLGVLAFYMG